MEKRARALAANVRRNPMSCSGGNGGKKRRRAAGAGRRHLQTGYSLPATQRRITHILMRRGSMTAGRTPSSASLILKLGKPFSCFEASFAPRPRGSFFTSRQHILGAPKTTAPAPRTVGHTCRRRRSMHRNAWHVCVRSSTEVHRKHGQWGGLVERLFHQPRKLFGVIWRQVNRITDARPTYHT